MTWVIVHHHVSEAAARPEARQIVSHTVLEPAARPEALHGIRHAVSEAAARPDLLHTVRHTVAERVGWDAVYRITETLGEAVEPAARTVAVISERLGEGLGWDFFYGIVETLGELSVSNLQVELPLGAPGVSVRFLAAMILFFIQVLVFYQYVDRVLELRSLHQFIRLTIWVAFVTLALSISTQLVQIIPDAWIVVKDGGIDVVLP